MRCGIGGVIIFLGGGGDIEVAIAKSLPDKLSNYSVLPDQE